MATPLIHWLQKAEFTTDDLSGGSNGGELSPAQAQAFLRDAIEATVILRDADVFDSPNPAFEIPKISFANRIMYAGAEGTRVVSGERQQPSTSLVSIFTHLFRGEVPVSDEVFEDQVERAGLANTLVAMIAEAVGRDLEDIAIKSDTDDADPTYSQFNGLVQQLVDANENVEDVNAATTVFGMFDSMIAALPSRYRRVWDQLRLYVPIHVHDAYAIELADRGTQLGDSNVVDKLMLRYRGIPVSEVPLLSGTQDGVAYDEFAILCVPRNLKVGFHRRVRLEQYRDPREGMTSYLPTVRYDLAWAQPEAVVLAENVPAFPVPAP